MYENLFASEVNTAFYQHDKSLINKQEDDLITEHIHQPLEVKLTQQIDQILLLLFSCSTI